MISVLEFLSSLQPPSGNADELARESPEKQEQRRASEERRRDMLRKSLRPCYFLHGDEPFLGRRFVSELRDLLLPLDGGDFNIDRFWMDESGWAEVIDAARTAPSMFSPWRLTVAEFLTRSEERLKDRDEDKLSEVEEKLLEDYLQRPISLPGTVLVVLYPSRSWKYKQAPVFKFFSAHVSDRKRRTAKTDASPSPGAQVVALEMMFPKDTELQVWLNDELKDRKLILNQEARKRLIEVVGNDLQRLASEMDKLQTYAADKTAAVLKEEDIDQVCAWTREMEAWSLTDALQETNWPRCVEVLDKLFKEGEAEIKILNDIIRFFQEIQMAKAWLREQSKDRRAVFSALRPNIARRGERGDWYEGKFRDFFRPVDLLSRADLRRLFGELGRIDSLLKSSDASPRPMLESFLFDYCRRMKGAPLRRTVKA